MSASGGDGENGPVRFELEVDEDVDPLRSQRDLRGVMGWVVRGLGLAFALYYLVRSGTIGTGSPQLHRGLFVGVSSVLVLLVYPANQARLATARRNRRGGHTVPPWDLLLALLGGGSALYFVTQLPAMASRSGAPTTTDVVVGAIAVIIALEVSRRTTGWFIPIMAVVALAYVFVGPWMPGMFQHGGYTVTRVTGIMFTSFNGLFGIVASIFANFVFLFIIFGTVLNKTGASRFFVELPFALAGRLRGGPAKVAVLVSAIMGSISGSAVANVMTTGVFTIPLMKRMGYRKEFAGGVEAAASTGGGILPPVMGAAAFVLAEFTGIPYGTVALYSIVPALMYFAGVYFLVDFEALKENLSGIHKDELPAVSQVFKEGWFYFVPLITVFALVIMNYSPAFAGFWGTVAAAAVGLLPYRGKRSTLADYVSALYVSSIAALPVAGIVGTLGIIIGVINLTGLGLKFSSIIINAAGGSLLLAIVLVTLTSWVLGMGMTVTTSYIVVAILAAPALTELGVSLLAAHLIILWVSQDANVTPPICVAAFAAASIAGGSLNRTGWEAWKLARGLYVIPLLMAYTPLVDGTIVDILHISVSGTLGIYFFSASVSGYLVRRCHWLERVILMGAAAGLILPDWPTNFLGVTLGLAVYLVQKRTRRRSSQAPDESGPGGSGPGGSGPGGSGPGGSAPQLEPGASGPEQLGSARPGQRSARRRAKDPMPAGRPVNN